ncbi:MAG: hypothetical protein E6J91_03680 [Deltaproteobacteria bacterium]|nr:MAG: hypothetical protein E6J91_03680 [Deltaproteobacteria bacterium]
MMNQAWEDAFQELWNHAAHHRGVREALADPVGPTLSDTLHQWPRTRCADVVGIGAIVDAVLRSAPLVSGAHGVERRWRRCAGQLADLALGEPTLEYRHNRAFWSALASIVAYLASVDAPVPEPMWGALLAELAQPMPEPRNTAVVDERLHLAAFNYDELWQAQKEALAKLRGSDIREPGPTTRGARMKVPRTTNADVLQLATYWTSALAQVEIKRRQMGPHGPEALHGAGIDGEIRRWREALRDVDNYATTGDPATTYPKNEAFWRATGSVSITVAVIDDAPPPFEMLTDTIVQRMPVQQLPISRNRYRNATYPGEGTNESMWDKVHDDFVQARGFDTRDALPGRVGRPMKIPRTLNAEVIKLAAYWNDAWHKLESRRGILGNLPTEHGLDTLKKRWQAVMKDVHDIAEPGKVEDVYPKNHEFWRESFELAQTLDLFNELPSKLDIAWDVTKTLPDRFADVVGKVAHAIGDVANRAAEGVTSGLGKPILIAGSVVVGGLLLWRWLRPSPTTVAV